jgi:hypothetical protein
VEAGFEINNDRSLKFSLRSFGNLSNSSLEIYAVQGFARDKDCLGSLAMIPFLCPFMSGDHFELKVADLESNARLRD